MNYWWNENLSGIWATFIWTYSPYLCTGILTAFFNFSFGFWIYSRSLSFCKHPVNLHYKSGLYRGLWVHCHHSLTSSSSQPHHFPLSFLLCSRGWHLVYRDVPGVHRHRAEAGGTAIIWEESQNHRSMWLIVILIHSPLCHSRKHFCYNSHLRGSDWSSSCSSEIAGAIDKVTALISKYQQPLRTFQMKN